MRLTCVYQGGSSLGFTLYIIWNSMLSWLHWATCYPERFSFSLPSIKRHREVGETLFAPARFIRFFCSENSCAPRSLMTTRSGLGDDEELTAQLKD